MRSRSTTQLPKHSRHGPGRNRGFRPSLLRCDNRQGEELAGTLGEDEPQGLLAHLVGEAILHGFDPSEPEGGISATQVAQLKEPTWLDAHGNVVLAGPPGLGKTMVAVGLGLLAIDEGHAVAFEKMESLVRIMDDAEVDRKAGFRLRYLRKRQLLIVDEIGHAPIAKAQASRFFSLVSDAYERQSLAFTTNKEIPDWAEMVQDPVLATAPVGRILHHARCFSLRGGSYRLKHPELYAHRD